MTSGEVNRKALFSFVNQPFVSETCPFGSDFIGSFRVDTIIFLLIDCLRCESGRASTCILRYSAVKAIVGDTISASEPTAR